MSLRITAALATRICALALVTAAPLVPAGAESMSDKMNNFFFGPPAQPNAPRPGDPVDIPCPSVDVREGATTLAINAPGQDPGPMNTRYQVSIGGTARECAPLGGMMSMRVGVEGRVLLGPAGGPGQVDLPLRIAVVQEGPEPKPIISKMVRLTVSVAPGQTGVPFRHIEQDLAFPMPSPSVLENYVVYVGFDPAAPSDKPVRKTKKGPAPAKRKPKQ